MRNCPGCGLRLVEENGKGLESEEVLRRKRRDRQLLPWDEEGRRDAGETIEWRGVAGWATTIADVDEGDQKRAERQGHEGDGERAGLLSSKKRKWRKKLIRKKRERVGGSNCLQMSRSISSLLDLFAQRVGR